MLSGRWLQWGVCYAVSDDRRVSSRTADGSGPGQAGIWVANGVTRRKWGERTKADNKALNLTRAPAESDRCEALAAERQCLPNMAEA